MARSMLQTKGLSNIYWAEAIRTAVYILNRSSTSSLDGITPFEAWYEKRSNVNHFRVFGCLAYVHLPKEHRQKLDQKSEPCIFIGYFETSKAYRLYNPKMHKFVILRDVIFYEGRAWSHQK